MSHGGKGSKRRPSQISDEELERRWAAIFQASQAVEREPEPEDDEGWPENLPAYKRQPARE